MKNAIEITMDGSGRLVLPKAVRERAGLVPDIPLLVSVDDGRVLIEPAPRAVRIVRKGRLSIAVPLEESEPLTDEAVRRVRDAVRERAR
jgi:bifunctional DNA-binding transcriptional regulator/antitoxin component of YhaV-PrlF toxin-antitoxin module